MDTTTNQLIASSSSMPPSWDVFLSFYGKDTRANFVANLYFALDQAGITPFKDKPALEIGEEISPGLLNAINDSKMFVVVISENYARSSWCLDELVEILNCKTTKNQVVPVFYYVDLSHLRYQLGTFKEALEKHQERYSVDVITKWKYALSEISKLSGYHLRKNADENESDTIQDIVKNVAAQTSTKRLYLGNYLIGTESAVEEIYQKLRIKSNDVHVIGICGMGGIGKTTIAKAFYNRYSNKFDISCFIENVKQNSRGRSNVLPLLQELLTKLLRKKDYVVQNFESGISQLNRLLVSNKALVVLDDWDQSNKSDLLRELCRMFSVGSRLIITTRDVNLLNQLRVDISEVYVYMVKELGHIDSLKLFSYHAFGKPTPPESFTELSEDFVTYAGGIPLALTILGSSLRGRTEISFWKAKLEKVREISEKQIQGILQLSYEELGDVTQKSIFLDIVFFFVGKDKDEAVNVFKSCNFFPDVGIPILVERCLLIIDEDNKFQVHNLIQEMGREVMREESRHGKCRRLYLSQVYECDTLLLQEGTDKIEGLIIDLTMWTKRQFSAKIFERLPNLRLLEVIDAHDIKGNFENSFYELRCIYWSHCPWTTLPSSFRPQKLVSLHMPFSKLKTLWKNATPSRNLKSIDVSYSKSLKTTPDFRDSKLVEKLSFCGCKSLVEVHPSIGQLSNLGHLDLGECENLKELAEPIGQLTKLGHLDLRGCIRLKRLPEPMKHLTNLGQLYLGGCRNLKGLPEQLGDMKRLKRFDASYTAIEQLPNSIAELKGLVVMSLYSCKKLTKLPEQFGNMEGLCIFDASWSGIEQLPDSFGQLINLIDLQLSHCKKLTTLPNSIWKLKYLQVLDIGFCSKLERLPEQLGKMQSLEKLHACCTAIEELPYSVGMLSRLQWLELSWCKKLKYLPNSIWNLTSLANLNLLNSDVFSNLPGSVKLTKLETLDLSCNIRFCMPFILKLSSLKTLRLSGEGESLSSSTLLSEGEILSLSMPLSEGESLSLSRPVSESESSTSSKPFSLSKLSNLEHLTLENCTSLGSSFPKLPLNLTELKLYNHATLEQLPRLSNLKHLSRLIIRRYISLRLLPPLPYYLHSLEVYECTSLHSFPLLPPYLKSLEAHGCTSLQDLPDLSLTKQLETLIVINCRNLKSVILTEISLQVGRYFFSLPFKADLSNTEVAEWFSYKSSGHTISFDVPQNLGDNFLGIALWVVYTCIKASPFSHIRAVITNKTKDITTDYDISIHNVNVGQVQSRIECIKRNSGNSVAEVQPGVPGIGTQTISVKSGDKIKVSFQRFLYSSPSGGVEKAPTGEMKVEMCGAHVIQKTP